MSYSSWYLLPGISLGRSKLQRHAIIHLDELHFDSCSIKLMCAQARALLLQQWRCKGRSNWWCRSCITSLCNASPTTLWSTRTWLASPTIWMLVCRFVFDSFAFTVPSQGAASRPHKVACWCCDSKGFLCSTISHASATWSYQLDVMHVRSLWLHVEACIAPIITVLLLDACRDVHQYSCLTRLLW